MSLSTERERVYGCQLGTVEPGNGWRFRGHGLIQLTGRDNYAWFAAAIGVPLDDALLARLETQTRAAESAARWWQANDCNALVDTGDIAMVRRRVNGGSLGWPRCARLGSEGWRCWVSLESQISGAPQFAWLSKH